MKASIQCQSRSRNEFLLAVYLTPIEAAIFGQTPIVRAENGGPGEIRLVADPRGHRLRPSHGQMISCFQINPRPAVPPIAVLKATGKKDELSFTLPESHRCILKENSQHASPKRLALPSAAVNGADLAEGKRRLAALNQWVREAKAKASVDGLGIVRLAITKIVRL